MSATATKEWYEVKTKARKLKKQQEGGEKWAILEQGASLGPQHAPSLRPSPPPGECSRLGLRDSYADESDEMKLK